jgi:Na+/citrate or Na+/malate symporter
MTTESQTSRSQYTVTEKAQEEGNKLLYDTLKHLTTLSTGSIVLLATFLEKLFKTPHWKALVVIAFISFLISIVVAFVTMGFVGDRVYSGGRSEEFLEKLLLWLLLASISLFLTGVTSFAAFSLRNFFG